MIRRKVLMGTDWWTDCDDVVAMRLLVWAEVQGLIEIAGIGINACMEVSAPSLDAFLTAEGRPGIALGIDLEAVDFGGNPPYQHNMIADGARYRSNEECENAVRLYRRCLAKADGKLDIIEIGYPQVLARLLKSSGDDLSPMNGLELVASKVRKLWMMAGNWENKGNGVENNFARNVRSREAGKYVCEHWPTVITFLGWEVSSAILTGGTLTSPTDLVAKALRNHNSASGRSSWDPMLVLLACIGIEEIAGYRVVRGTARVEASNGENFFEEDPNGKHGYVVKVRPDEYYRQEIDRILESREN
ncbi:hypothetical protein [Paenibacillus sp. PAMC21692]|uniref:hypothetical protein n=1 Tax=Paenibacillus sp. PAMC21692 TaxID=2762320 RepID=UPI00164E61FC|nr:hypothetical protein [Paenibacillus sp. PAMC21692]QNK56997.1 hypothetical protein H7F31_31630 [Paenibacillus sp. PAMC21692]